jgi:hypothetical protein
MRKVLVGASALFLAMQAHAASVVDTATKAAISSGFTDLKDTLLDLLTTAFPFIVAGSVIMATPYIVKRLIALAGSK